MTLPELQDNLYDLLCLIDDICRKENVRYFLDSGTAIGAVREHDIVPWDDDVDIKVMREDYPAFKAAMLKHLPEHYHFIEPEDMCPVFFDFVPRVIVDNVLLREEREEDRYYKNYRNRLCIDVFIFDRAPDSKLLQSMMRLKCKLLYGMAMSKRYKLRDEKYTLSQKLMSRTCILLGKPLKMEKILLMWNRHVTKYSGKETEYRISANYSLKNLLFFREEWYNETVYMKLRERELPLPNGYDGELSLMYGDYMKPPKDRSVFIKHFES